VAEVTMLDMIGADFGHQARLQRHRYAFAV
jgi:hypothetical protein